MPVETRYFRSDQQTVNAVTAYVLGTSESASKLQISIGSEENSPTCYYGIKVYKVSSSGTKTLISSGVVAIVSLAAGATFTGTAQNHWDCPLTSLAATDAVLIELYADLNTNPPTTLRRTWITEQLGATQLDAATWTVYYRVSRTRIYDPETGYYSYSFYFNHGISTDSSYITNFSWSVTVAAAPRMVGDGLTWIIS
jgi:hypothetical protein